MDGKSKLIICVLCLLELIKGVECDNKFNIGDEKTMEKPSPKSKIHEEYFAKMAVHDTPLYSCPKHGTKGIPYKIPKRPDCAPPPLDKVEIENVTIQTYWVDFKIQPIQAVECYMKTETNRVWTSFWGTPIRTKEEEYVVPFLYTDCIHLRENQQTKTGQELQFISSGFLGTDNHHTPEAKYFGSDPVVNKNTYIYHVDATVNLHDRTISTVGPVLTKACKVDECRCPTTRGILVWSKENFKTCRLKIGKKSMCLKVGHSLTCPELSITINHFQISKVCGIQLGSTGTGGFFSSDVAGEVIQGVDSSQTIMRHLEPIIPKPSKKRVKRASKKRDLVDIIGDDDEELIHDPGVVTYVDYPLQISYLINSLTKGDKSQLWNTWETICKNNAMMIDHVQHQAATGDATGMVQTLTGDKSLRATMHGDVVNVYGCEEIYEFQFITRSVDVNCTAGFPVRVIGADRVVREAWLIPGHELEQRPVPIDCPNDPYFFETVEGIVINLDEKREVDGLDTLPNPGKSVAPNETIDVSFNPGPLYTLDELTGSTFKDQQRQKADAVRELGGAVWKLRNGKKVTSSEGSAVDAVGDYWGGPFMKVLYGVLILLAIIVVALLIFFITYYWEPITKFFAWFWRAIKRRLGCAVENDENRNDENTNENANANANQNQVHVNLFLKDNAPLPNAMGSDKQAFNLSVASEKVNEVMADQQNNFRRREALKGLPEDVVQSVLYPDLVGEK